MNCPDYNSPSELKNILDQNGFSMQKKFGQNFLLNADARTKIIDSLDIKNGTTVWEVGPGLGSMTAEILKRGARLTVFEIDRGFVKLLNTIFEDEIKSGALKIVEGDALKNWKKEIEQGVPQRFFGNLPYNIAATLIGDTIEKNIRFEKCVFTVQKEVALRMRAKASSKDYSSFSVLCQWAYNLSPIMDLTGANFWPRPNVDSQAVLFTKKEDFPGCKNPALFVKMQRALFSSRRKNVRNNLTGFIKNSENAQKALELSKIEPSKRAEVLTIPELLSLSDAVFSLQD